MKRVVASPSSKNGAKSKMEVDQESRKALRKVKADPVEESESSVEDSSSSASNIEEGGYETGDSELIEQVSDSEDEVQSGSESDASSGDNGDNGMDIDVPEIAEEDQKLVSKAQQMLRTSVDDEMDRIQVTPASTSRLFQDTQAESNLIRSHLKALKSTIEQFSDVRIKWKSSKEPSDRQLSSSKSKSSSSEPEFDATSFLQTHFDQIGGSNLVMALRKELSDSAPSTLESPKSKSASADNDIYTWQHPSSINVVGSYLLGTALRCNVSKSSPSPIYSVDLAVTMPETIFKHKDIKGHRYETKKLLYLAVLGRHLERSLTEGPLSSSSGSSINFKNLKWGCDGLSHLSAPYLSLDIEIPDSDSSSSSSSKKRRRSTKTSRIVQLNIRPVITPTTFKLAQLLPWKPQLGFSGNMPIDHQTEVYNEISASINNVVPESPLATQKATRSMFSHHNHRILRDALTTTSTKDLAAAFAKCPELKNAVLLAMRWLLARHLHRVFNTYIVSMFFVHLHAGSVFKPNMDALDMFKAWISWLAKDKIAKLIEIERSQVETHGSTMSNMRSSHTPAPVLVMANKSQFGTSKSDSEEFKSAFQSFSDEVLKKKFAECYEVVLIDRTGFVNVLADVSSAAWSNLQFEAVLSVHVLEHPDQFTFMTLFKTSISQSDKSLHINSLPPVASEFDALIRIQPQSHLLPSIKPVPLPSSLTIYKEAVSTSKTKQLQSSAMLGSRKAATKAIEITSTSDGKPDTLQVDDAKTKEATDSLSSLSKSTVPLNALDSLMLQQRLAEILLFQALALRVEYISLSHSTSPSSDMTLPRSEISWPLHQGLPVADQVWYLGIRTHPTQWQKLLEYGPQAQNEEAVADFIRVWGKDKAGLRKFKDGVILYCVSWGVPPSTPSSENINNLAAPANKHRIVKAVISHLLNRHLSHFENPNSPPSHISSTSSLEWNVDIIGDQVLYEMLRSPERVDPELVGPTFKATPAPLSNSDSHDHISFVWTQLQKVLRSVKGLTMPIKTLSMPGPVARHSMVAPPEYNPLSDPEISFAQRQHAIRASAPASQLCPQTIPVIMMLESSGAWPEDLDAISHVKTALYLDLARNLGEQHGTVTATRTTSDALYIFFKGYSWRIQIFYPRELVLRNTLYRQAVIMQRREQQQKQLQERIAKMEQMKRIENQASSSGSIVPNASKSTIVTPEMLARARGPMVGPVDTNIDPLQSVVDDFAIFSISPKVSSLLHSLNLAYPAYGATCVLVKKWMSTHLLPVSDFCEGLFVDLLVARIFHASPYLCSPWSVPPSHPYAAFSRMLYFLANLSWETGPVVVPLQESHEGIANTIVSTSRGYQSPLGWSLDKIEKIQQRWEATDPVIRPVLSICFSDGSSSLDTDSEEQVLATTKIPGVATLGYGTANGSMTHSGWQVDTFVAKAILTRMRRLAQNALVHVSSQHNLDESSLSVLFEPSLLDFDVVVELKKGALTRSLLSNLERKKKRKNLRFIGQTSYLEAPSEYIHQIESIQSKVRSAAPPLLTDFDPVSTFIEKVSDRLGDKALVFHDSAGGQLIGIVLRPSAFTPTSGLSNSNIVQALPLTSTTGQRAGIIPNIVQILNELWSLGDGLVQQIHLVGGQHKLQ